jgi:phage terminase large subunit-like protein
MSDLLARLRDEYLLPRTQVGFFCDRDGCDGLPHGTWTNNHARTQQHPPPGDWRTWYVRGGRGSGKTRTASENLARMILDVGGGAWAILAPTFGDARKVCVEGQSGILAALGKHVARDGWKRTVGEIHVDNGAVIYIDGADDGANRIQGTNLCGAWCDEIGLWRRSWWQHAWNESLSFAVRIEPARIIATGTPKVGHGLVKKLLDDPSVMKTHMSTYDNLANLHPAAVAELEAAYKGSRLGRQELEGEFIEDIEGALWQRDQIEALTVLDAPQLMRIVVAIDPAGSPKGTTGIVVAGVAKTGHGYVLEDLSCPGTPQLWGSAAVEAYHKWGADRIVAERNYGGSMVEHVIRSVDADAAYKVVDATRGKAIRAEPIAALYEQGRVHHVGHHVLLVDQMCMWEPDSGDSPDRLDACVWALTELMLTGRKGFDPSKMAPVSMEKQSYFRGAG